MARSIGLICLICLCLSCSTIEASRPDWQIQNNIPAWNSSPGRPPAQIVATLPGQNIHKTPKGNIAFPDTVSIHRALKVGNVKSLDLRVALLGCSEWPDRWSLPLDLAGHDKYHSLRSLRLESYRFDNSEFERVAPPEGWPLWDSYAYEWSYWLTSGRAWNWFKWRMLPLNQRLKTNAALWADAMDWSDLQRLELVDLDGSEFVTHIGKKLTGLKELTLNSWRSCTQTNATATWLMSLPPLEKFVCLDDEGIITTLLGKGTEMDGPIPSMLENFLAQHGPALKRLEIRPERITSAGPFVSAPQVQRIGKLAPQLEHLSIAVHRNGTWPWETFEALSQLPHLSSIIIWLQYISDQGFQFNRPYYDPRYMVLNDTVDGVTSLYQEPLIDDESVQHIWKFLLEQARDSHPDSRLTNVSFWAGDWTRGWDGPLYFPPWYEGGRVGWTCNDTGCVDVRNSRDRL